MKWFGEPWPSADYRAPVCEDDLDRVPPPGPQEECGGCGQSFQEGAQGVVIPHISADRTSPWLSWTEIRYWHIDCLSKSVGA